MSDKAAYIMAAAISATIECEAMKAANQERQMKGESDAYGENAFWELKERLEEQVAEISRY